MEKQIHGFEFEKLIREDLTNILSKTQNINEHGYTEEYDIPPIQIKSFKLSSNTIEFGSLLRTFEKKDSFILVLIGYKKEKNIKRVIFSESIYIKNKIWNEFKGKLKKETINELEEIIKSFKEGEHVKARFWAKNKKKEINNLTNFDIRFKIDSKKQRRIQCALNLSYFLEKMNITEIKNTLEIKDLL